MDNYILMKYSKEIEELSKSLGWERTLFLDRDFIFIETEKKKELLDKVQKTKLLTVFNAKSEEMLRFALEKTKVDIVLGAEEINPKESLHFVRGGLDQITCKIAHEREKKIGFSFSSILSSKSREKLLRRISFNTKLCKKYKVSMLFSTFARSKEELRNAKDLQTFARQLKLN
jgi:RNase P/RNase MRP subunit p30